MRRNDDIQDHAALSTSHNIGETLKQFVGGHVARHLALHRPDWAACLSAASFLHRGQDRFQLSVAELIMSDPP
jgi:hypothetical protein